MSKSIVLVLLCIFKAVYGVEPENQKPEAYAPESAGVDLPSAESLANIERNEVLPLLTTLQSDKYPFQYQLPEKLLKYELTEDGKISNGTEFGPREEGHQIFFCPWAEDDQQKKCLVRQTFEKSEIPKCAMEQTPEWVNMEIKCGNRGKGTIFESVYKVCARDEYPLDPPFISFYQICYDTKNDKILYTSHEIKSPGLLNLNLLTKERSIDYSMLNNLGDITSSKVWDARWIKPSYKLQQLVPPEDMAFAAWRKTTFSNLNYERLHEKLINVWDEISTNIRSVAKKYVSPGEKFFVNTAIDDYGLTSLRYSTQLSNIWVKMIYILKSTDDGERKLTHGTAILMHNFITSENNSGSKIPPLQEYCDQNHCIDELTKEINDIGSRIRCCKITPRILKIFEIKTKGEIEVIPIPNVTVPKNHEVIRLRDPASLEKAPIPNVIVSEDHEILRDPVSLEKAAESLQEIEPNEMLPLILPFFLEIKPLSFHRPTRIVKIEIKNRRIVRGSQFTVDLWRMENMSFCPQEDSNETCLVPKKFEEYEPLQCVKEAIPVVREDVEFDGKSPTCGFKGQGVKKKVIYEICPTEQPHNTFLNEIFYEFCYDIENKKILYTQHNLPSPRLLLSNLLLRERAMNHFDMMEDDSVPVSDSQDENSLPDYELQKLVPPEDMAFGLWKKSTYKRINADWQHKKLKPFWDKINNRIRNHILWHADHRPVEQNPFLDFITRNPELTNVRTSDNHYYQIYTGAFDLPTVSEGESTDNQKSNMWVKLIFRWIGSFSSEAEALVISMNNFLVSTNEQLSTSTTAKKKNGVAEYCNDTPCLKDVKTEIESIGGQIGCCKLTQTIADQFGMKGNFFKLRVMSIRGITL